MLFLLFSSKVSSLTLRFFHRWRMHKWQSCILVPESVQRGLSGQGEACGNGLETRGKSELSWLTHFLRCACQLPLHHRVQAVLLHPVTLSLMRLNSLSEALLQWASDGNMPDGGNLSRECNEMNLFIGDGWIVNNEHNKRLSSIFAERVRQPTYFFFFYLKDDVTI